MILVLDGEVPQEQRLFEMPATPMPKGLSADAKRTWRRRRLLEQGIHPATKLKLADNGEFCGTCEHARKNYRFWKCDRLELTFGPATDIRVSWPACTGWEPIRGPASV